MIKSRIKTIFTLSLLLCYLMPFTNAEVESIEYDSSGIVEKQSTKIDPNSVYSYLVTSDNREMIFEVYGTAEKGSFLTIGVKGNSTVTFSVDGVEEYPYIFDNLKILTFPITSRENISSMAKFKVKGANIGEFLTVSVHVVTHSLAEDNFLYPNGPTVIGMLDKSEGYYMQECFPVPAFTSEKYKNINKYYLTSKIHSKYALFWLADENDMYMEETEKEISDGQLSYIIQTNGKKRSVCFEFPYNDDIKVKQIAYSISIVEPTSL